MLLLASQTFRLFAVRADKSCYLTHLHKANVTEWAKNKEKKGRQPLSLWISFVCRLELGDSHRDSNTRLRRTALNGSPFDRIITHLFL